jgi:cyclohexanone monooxygenase
MLTPIQHHVDWIAGCIDHMRRSGLSRIDVEPAAQEAWAREVQEVANRTLYPLARSWYMGDNVPGKPRMFMVYVGGFANYAQRCEEIVKGGYAGFKLSASPKPALVAISSRQDADSTA